MPIALQCPRCGKTFFRFQCFVQRAQERGVALHCSKSCARTKRIILKCRVCHTLLARQTSKVTRSKYHYCSIQCKTAAYEIFAEERFWMQVNKNICLGDSCGCKQGLGCCWIWTGDTKKGGYGTFGYKKKNVPAHRMAFAFANNINVFDIPDGIQIAHECDITPCVRHLFGATCYENIHDSINKGRRTWPSGELHPSSRLTDDAIRLIRSLRGIKSQSTLAEQFGCSRSAISSIQRFKKWKHLI